MGKEKKKPKMAIKTSRYFTKSCSQCQYEYPNWFTNCPRCGLAWDYNKPNENYEQIQKKTIKIVVKITEEDFEQAIDHVQLVFSADQGKTWYKMKMDMKMDYFITEIAEVPIGSVIIYYIEVFLENGEKVIENNDGNYFYYKVGIPVEEMQEKPSQTEAQTIKNNIKNYSESPQQYPYELNNSNLLERTIPDNFEKKENHTIQSEKITIFGVPQTEIDPNLKICPHCNSKIKKIWTVCPICGKNI
ncbi:MAG: hypothetical protein ACTSPD_11970 [Promethearchaeota archaeon]